MPVPDSVPVERPRSKDHGDYATSVALQLAGPAGRPPRQVAELLAGRLREVGGIAEVEVAGPGFLNVRLAEDAAARVALQVVAAGAAYGRNDTGAGTSVDLEFVSANPTGPMHVGGVRWAALGDALARLLEASGATVTREYYVNDAGTQIDRFAQSLHAAATGGPVPEDGYAGEYVGEWAQRVLEREPGLLDLPEVEAVERFRVVGLQVALEEIRGSLAAFGVDFDVWFSEASLAESGRGRPGARAAARAGARRRARRRGVAAHDRLRRRQGPGARQERRHRHLLPVRRRLLRRQALARLRPLHLHARRRPPRLRRAAAGARRLRRRRPRPDPRGADRAARQRPAGRRAGEDEQARRHDGHARGPRRAHRRRRRPLHAGPLLRRHARWTSTSSSSPGGPATTPSSTCSTPRPARRSVLRNAADLGIAEPDPGDGRPVAALATRARPSCCSRSPSSRRSSRPRPSCASRTG